MLGITINYLERIIMDLTRDNLEEQAKQGGQVMSKLTILVLGIVIGLIIPLAIDLALFGTIQPCKTLTSYEDGSTTQVCHVRQ